jgi:hypothetical protein
MVDTVTANLNQLLRQQTTLREVAEDRARQARDALLRVAEALCSGALDAARQEDPGGLAGWDADQIADLVVAEVQGQLDQAGLSDVADDGDVDAVTLYQQAVETIERLQGELDRACRHIGEAEAAREQAEEQARLAQGRVQVLEQTVADLQRRAMSMTTSPVVAGMQQPLPMPVDHDPIVSAPPLRLRPGPEPEWMQAWRQERGRVFERTSALVIVIGETGECRRKQLAELAGERLNLSAKHSGVKRAFGYTIKRGLTEIVEFQQVISGGSTHLLRLTPKGQKAYLYLTQTEAAPSILDEMLRRHKSPEHAFLNLEAADLLEETGCTVDRFPAEMQLSEGRKFLPDLGAVSPAGEVLWVEVERDTHKRDRSKKWANYYEASGGHFVVVTADRQAMQRIRSEITFWAGERPLRLWMTNVTEVRAGERGKDGSIWLYRRGEKDSK